MFLTVNKENIAIVIIRVQHLRCIAYFQLVVNSSYTGIILTVSKINEDF